MSWYGQKTGSRILLNTTYVLKKSKTSVADGRSSNVPSRSAKIPSNMFLVKPLVVGEMEHAIQLDVPIKVDVGAGRNWFEAH